MEEIHMLRFHRLASAVALALVTVALLAPVAQGRPAVAGSATGGSKAPAVLGTTAATAKQSREAGGGGTDWNAVFAGAAASALIIAMCAGGIGLVRRRALAA
jgi:hypothetical protein